MEDQKFRERRQLVELVSDIEKNVDAVIVEGFSDRLVLKKLGFGKPVFQSAERTVEDLVEDVSRRCDKVAVLTDFDEHGKERGRKISRELEKEIDVLRSVRESFGKQLTGEGRRAVEDVMPLFEDKEEKFVDATLSRLYTFE